MIEEALSSLNADQDQDQDQEADNAALDWAVWVSSFWVFRGALAAMSLIALIPNFFDLSRYDVLRVFHVLLWAWDAVLTDVGWLIGQLPFMPVLSFADMTALIVALNILVPAALAFTITTVKRFSKWNILRRIFELLALLIWYYAICLSFLGVHYVAAGKLLSSDIITFSFVIVALPFILLTLLSAALWDFKRMRSGFLFFLGTIVFFELAYYAASPVLADFVNMYICNLEVIPSIEC